MITDILFFHAQQALRSVPASQWDDIGYQMFEAAIKNSASEEEKIAAWKKAIAYLHAGRSSKFYAYVRMKGKFADITEEEIIKEQNENIETEIAEWEDAKFKIIERVSDTLTFLTTKGENFDLTTDDIFSQSLFRKAYFKGTNRMLPQISGGAYQKFIARLPFTVVEGYSQSKKEMLEEMLFEMSQKMENFGVETEKEAIETVLKRGKCIYENFLFFKFNDLLNQLRQNNRPYEQQAITVALKCVGAKQVHAREGNYWIHNLKKDPEITEHDHESESTMGTDSAGVPF